MSVILYEKENFGSMAYHLTHTTQDLRDLAIPYHEKLELQRFKCKPQDEDNNIICWVDRLFIANQLAFHQTYTKTNKFEIETLDDKDIRPTLNWDNKKLYDWLNRLDYNLYSNGGRSFISEDDHKRLKNLTSGLARRIIEGPLHYGSF